MAMQKGKYQGQDVEIVRPAHKGDNGFQDGAGEQLIIKGADGKEKTVKQSEVDQSKTLSGGG